MSSKPAKIVIKLKTVTTSSPVAAAVSTNVENTLMTRGTMNVLCARYLYIFKSCSPHRVALCNVIKIIKRKSNMCEWS